MPRFRPGDPGLRTLDLRPPTPHFPTLQTPRPAPLPSPAFRSMADTVLMDKLVSLCKRRGFVFQSSEIYGGLGSVWDYGPLGVELKKNVKDRWWRAMVHARDDIEGLDAAILMHPRVWEASGHVSGFTDPLVDCKHCKNRFRADDTAHQGHAGPARRAVPGVRQPRDADRAAHVQPHVQDVHGAGGGAGGRRLPAAGDGPGHLRQLPERAAELAAEDPVRHRADRQGVPQRDHARQLHLPHPRVRADGDAVLREAGDRRGVVRALARVADGMAPRPRSHARQAAVAPARPRRAGALRPRGLRHPVRVSLRLAGDRRHPQPGRLRSRTPPGVLGQEARVLRPGRQRALPAVHRGDLGRRRPGGAHAAGGCLSGGGGRGRDARRARAPPVCRTDQGRRISAGEEGRNAGAGRRAVPRSQAPVPHVLRRQRGHRPALPAHGRGRNAVRDHGRRRDRLGTHGHRPAP